MNPAVKKLREDLAFSVASNRPDAEAIVITDQATVREVLTEIEWLKDQIQNPQFHAKPRN